MRIQLKPIEQQTVVITGASSGIGLATAREAARRGARVMLAARTREALETISSELRDEGADVDFRVTDVSVEEDVSQLAQNAIDRFGGFDTWVNNAGVGIVGRIEETTTADHHRIFETNYFGLVYGSLEAVRHFRETGKHGALVNLGSVVSDIPIAMSVAYGATKHAIKGFTEGLRIELARDELPVSVTLIKPSGIDTPFFDHAHTLTPGMGKAPGPNYAPSVVADAILHAAEHVSRDLAIGSTAASAAFVEGAAPQVFDAVQKSMSIDKLIDAEHDVEDDNLYRSAGRGRERSRFGSGRGFSLTTQVQTAPPAVGMGTVALLLGLGALALSAMPRTPSRRRR